MSQGFTKDIERPGVLNDLSDVNAAAPADTEVLTWVAASSEWQAAAAAGGGGSTFADNVFRVQDDGDATKEIAFQASSITTSTVRTITMPDANVDLTNVHAESHTIASHSDTTATGAELETLTDGSDADSLHVHNHGNLTGLVDPADHPQHPIKTGWDLDYSSSVTITMVDGTRTVSIAPTGANFTYWISGVQYTQTV